ncbi:hypothetical protein DL93DRAFT_2095444 [Clavulina sp. PMI_390]|nr:hypothetical protein DL93DRAFT_2095444 [Clavulina sp. PMI_390]
MLSPVSVFTTLFLAATSTLAAPAALEERDSPKCVTYSSGFLATGLTSGSWYPFSLNSDNQFIYTSPSGGSIWAQFQTCEPNYAGAANAIGDPRVYGRIYVPDSKSCVAVDPDAGTANLVSCLNSASGAMGTAASAPQNFAFDGLNLYWYGSGDVSLNRPSAGSCIGYYAYLHGSNFASPPDRMPVVTEDNMVQYVCEYKNGDADIFAALRETPSGTVSSP